MTLEAKRRPRLEPYALIGAAVGAVPGTLFVLFGLAWGAADGGSPWILLQWAFDGSVLLVLPPAFLGAALGYGVSRLRRGIRKPSSGGPAA
jgi:hypothetical protein